MLGKTLSFTASLLVALLFSAAMLVACFFVARAVAANARADAPAVSAEAAADATDAPPAADGATAAAAPAAEPATPPAADPNHIVIRRILDIDGPIQFGHWYWDDAGVPDGPMVITVDLKAQVLSVFRDGYEIGTTAVIFGTDDYPTPTGTFPITEKDADHVSNLYDAPMPFMLRMTNDGISIHGSDIASNFVTHGCIGVPTDFAEKLFGVVKLGDRVIVTDGGRMLGLGSPIAER